MPKHKDLLDPYLSKDSRVSPMLLSTCLVNSIQNYIFVGADRKNIDNL